MSTIEVTKVIPVPSLNHPFGIKLWPLFEEAYTKLMGYRPQDFKFKSNVTPMSTVKEAFTVIALYYVVILGGRELMRSRPAYELNTLFKIHNFILTAVSGVLLVLFLDQIIPTISKNGLFYAICHHDGGWTPHLVTLYYLNYLTKYVELLDTVFLVLKKKPLTFLHCYHHGATALLCFSQMVGVTTVSWVPITLNLTVHVIMYWYYFQSARGIRIWWKEWITRLQIIQFIIDLGFIYYASYTLFVSNYYPSLPHQGSCAGENHAALSGMGILTSYLVLFISFYIATYSKASNKKSLDRQSAKTIKEAEESQGIMNSGSSYTPSGRSASAHVARSRKA